MDPVQCRTLFEEAGLSGGRCDLRYQELYSDDALVIAEELAVNTTVTSLNMWKNNISKGGAKAIAAAIASNATLKSLDVEGNGVGDVGARAFARALQGNHTLTTLNLSRNGLTDAGARSLVVALTRNHSLVELDISKNTEITLVMKNALRSALKTNLLRAKAMSALTDLAAVAASDPVSLAAVRSLAAGEGVSEQGMEALDELSQDAGMDAAATQAMHALAEAQKQAAIARKKVERSVLEEVSQHSIHGEAVPTRRSSDSNEGSAGRNEWVAQVDDSTGKTYYWNTRTHSTTWKRPNEIMPGQSKQHSPTESEDDGAEDDEDEERDGEQEEETEESDEETDEDEEDSDDGLRASDDILCEGRGNGVDARPDDTATAEAEARGSLQQAMEAGSIAERAIEHDSNGEIPQAISCYKQAGELLLQAAEHSQQSHHFQSKADEYISRARMLKASVPHDGQATSKRRSIKLSKKAVAQAVKQMETDPMQASVEHVGGWLASLGLSAYLTNFQDQLVDGPMLAELTDQQMQSELGVEKMGERGKIRRARDDVFGRDRGQSTKTVTGPALMHGQLADRSDKAIVLKSHSSSTKRDNGQRIKVQVRLGHDGEWINLKLHRSDMSVDVLRPRLASALQVHEHALGHLQYRDKSGEWFAALEDDDIFDGVADLGGRYLVLQAIGSNSADSAAGISPTESLADLVSPFQISRGGPAREKAAAKAKRLMDGGDADSSSRLVVSRAGQQSQATSALDQAREHRPEQPQQIQTRLQRLMEQGQVDEAVSTLSSWAPGRSAMMETPTAPYNALLKLANDKKLNAGISATIVQLMASRGIEPDKAAYTHFLRSLIRDQDLDFAVRVLGKMHDEGFPAGVATYGGIIDAYVGKEELTKAVQLGSKAVAAHACITGACWLVEQDAAPSMEVLNRLLVASANAGARDTGVATFKLMQAAGWTPDIEAFQSLVQCAVGSGDLALSVKAVEQMVEAIDDGLSNEAFHSVLGLCQATESKVEAVRVFQLMQAEGLKPDATAYAALLDCAHAAGDLQLCMSILEQMSGAGMAPGLLAFNQLLALAAENKAKDAAVNMYELMITKGPIDPDEKSFGAMINCAWACGDVPLASQHLKDMVAAGFTPSIAAINALLAACTRSSDALDIVKIVQSSAVVALDSMSYSELLRCATSEKNLELSFRILKQASRSAVDINEATLALLLDAACAIDICQAMQLLQLLMASGSPPSTSLINRFLELCDAHEIDGNMLIRVEALLESLTEAGSSVDLPTKQAFKDLRNKTLKQEQQVFVTKKGGESSQTDTSDSNVVNDLFVDPVTERQARVTKMNAPIPERKGAEEWVEAFDTIRQKRYYYHKVTKETRWKRPQI